MHIFAAFFPPQRHLTYIESKITKSASTQTMRVQNKQKQKKAIRLLYTVHCTVFMSPLCKNYIQNTQKNTCVLSLARKMTTFSTEIWNQMD